MMKISFTQASLLKGAGLGAAVLGLSLAATTAAAQEYPTKPITIVAPYGAGGASDLASRTLAGVMPNYIGQPMMVINRAGAGGVTGSAFVAKGKADGYTLLLARIGSQSVSPAMKSRMPYKYDDFTMIGILELNPVICATAADKPYKTLEDVIDAVRANPGKLSYSSAGVGSFLHITVPFVLDTAGIPNANKAMKHIPYKGGGNAATAVVGGHVDFICTNSGALSGHIQSGKLRALLVTTKERLSWAPDVPTVSELGYPELEKLIGWSGLFGPPGMDPAVVKKLRDALQEVKDDKAWNKFTKALGSVPYILDGPDTKDFVDTQYNAFKALVEKLNMKI